jgi:hypothetical protein
MKMRPLAAEFFHAQGKDKQNFKKKPNNRF